MTFDLVQNQICLSTNFGVPMGYDQGTPSGSPGMKQIIQLDEATDKPKNIMPPSRPVPTCIGRRRMKNENFS